MDASENPALVRWAKRKLRARGLSSSDPVTWMIGELDARSQRGTGRWLMETLGEEGTTPDYLVVVPHDDPEGGLAAHGVPFEPEGFPRNLRCGLIRFMELTTAPAQTTAAGLKAAREIFRGDWDENGTTSIHLPAAMAVRLLEARGWDRQTNGRWNAPDGLSFTWDASEALTLALGAEVSR